MKLKYPLLINCLLWLVVVASCTLFSCKITYNVYQPVKHDTVYIEKPLTMTFPSYPLIDTLSINTPYYGLVDTVLLNFDSTNNMQHSPLFNNILGDVPINPIRSDSILNTLK